MGFNFADRETPIRLRKMLDEQPRKALPKQGVAETTPITQGWIFMTPSGGIPARSGAACGSADCTPYYINSSGNLVELKDDSGSSQTVEVWNIFGSDVGGLTYITAKECYGLLCADSEDCG